jgi:hypothetical protein
MDFKRLAAFALRKVSEKITGPKPWGPRPWIHPTATVIDSALGDWTEVLARASVTETTVGDYTYICNDSEIIYSNIGKFCSIAAHVRINPGNHPLDKATLHAFTYRSAHLGFAPEDDAAFFEWRRSYQVSIGADVWIGHGAIILPGVTVGTGAAIGAGSVVTKNVAPFSIVAGVPARLIRPRFSEDVQEGLDRIRWWDWPRERIQSALPDFRTLDARAFVEKYGSDSRS